MKLVVNYGGQTARRKSQDTTPAIPTPNLDVGDCMGPRGRPNGTGGAMVAAHRGNYALIVL